MRPNPPRIITVVVAAVLTIVGLALVFYQAQAIDLVRQVGLPVDLQRLELAWMEDRTFAWGALAASPLLLIVGSLLPYIQQ